MLMTLKFVQMLNVPGKTYCVSAIFLTWTLSKDVVFEVRFKHPIGFSTQGAQMLFSSSEPMCNTVRLILANAIGGRTDAKSERV